MPMTRRLCPTGWFFAAVACVILAFASIACRRSASIPNVAREDAYRSNNRGVALLDQFRYDEAAAAFRQALATDSSLAIVRVNLSLALLYAQDLQGAAQAADDAARLLPQAPQPPYVLGLIARTEGRRTDAVRFFERVLQLDARDVGAGVNLGQMYLEERRYVEAVTALERASAEEPYNVTAVYNLGLALTRSGREVEGQRALNRSQTLRATPYAVTYGTGYLEQGRYAEAIASSGAEPELVDTATSRAAFSVARVGPSPNIQKEPSPFGRPFSAADLTSGGTAAIAAALGGGLTLFDADRDGDLDLFVASMSGQDLFRNDGRGVWTDVTVAAGLDNVPPDGVPIGAVAADYDNDGSADLFVLRYGTSSLYRNDGASRFTDVAGTARLPRYAFLPGAAAFADVDHDGDLDLVIAGLVDPVATRAQLGAGSATAIFPSNFAPAPLQLLRNNGNGTFTDITREAGLAVMTHAVAVAPTDFDNRRDIDLLVVNYDAPPFMFRNLRDGTFVDVAADAGLVPASAPGDPVLATAVADLNKDDFPDIFFGRVRGALFALSDGRGRFTITRAPDGLASASASQFVDYDNDGLLDLLVWSNDSPRVWRNLGQRWSDVSANAIQRDGGLRFAVSAHGMTSGDVDGDGHTDLVGTHAGDIAVWRNGGDPSHRALRVRLEGRASNRLGVGAKIQLRAGSLSARLETSAATPSAGPADVVFGLGRRTAADVVRLLWPSGILQAEVPGSPTSSLTVTELDRKPSSCPFLFTWNGTRFEFVTDFIGGGEMGYWEGPGHFNRPDPVEYVRIRGDQLQPANGRFELRVTNELEEVLFADQFQLHAIDHPNGIDVFPNEGMTEPPKPFRLYAARDQRVPPIVLDDHGHDVTGKIASLDRQYPDDFPLSSIRGYAAEHTLSIDLGPPPHPATLLLLTGWTDYAFSSDKVAAGQAGLSVSPPTLQARNVAGAWRTIVTDVGIPVGRPQTIPIDLTARLRPGEHEVRLVTNMRVYWDQILIATAADASLGRTTRLDPSLAVLRARGFSAVVKPDGREPEGYDYGRVTFTSPWKAIPGRYTREGDVRDLVTRADDLFVIAKPGDELVLGFDATKLAPVREGWSRTFLLLADGFSKEMDINSASPDVVEPLPFHQMSQYPYRAPEHYPDTPAHRFYRDTYNTRVVIKSLPSLDAQKP